MGCTRNCSYALKCYAKFYLQFMKKILFLTFWYPDDRNPVKGVFIIAHARALLQAGYDVRVFAVNITHSGQWLSVERQWLMDEAGLPVYLLNIRTVFHKWLYVAIPLLSRWVYREYLKFIQKRFEPDIVHSHVLNPAAIAGHFLAKSIHKPHIVTEHWSKVDKFFRKNLFACAGAKAYNQADGISVVSQHLKTMIAQRVKNSSKIFVVPNVVPPVFSYLPHLPADVLRFTVVAKWEPPKNIQMLVDALQIVAPEAGKPILLQIVGEGSLLKPIFENRYKYHFAIDVLGFLPKNRIAKLLQHTDLFLHCSDSETFSVVTAEALCTGVPVVVSNVGALPELVDDHNGVLCSNTPEDWARAIQQALRKPFDRKQISSEAILLYSAASVAQLFGEVYDRAIQGHQSESGGRGGNTF